MQMSSKLSPEEGESSNRVGSDPHKAERDIVHVREGFHSFSLEVLSETLQPWSQRQTNIAGPMGSPCWTPLEQAIVVVSPESIRENVSGPCAVSLGR